jgi:hypothetical protein
MHLSIAIDINGLSAEHQLRIREVGLDRWLDEQCAPPKKPTRYSLEVRQARMRKRLRVAARKAGKAARGWKSSFQHYLNSDFRSVAY